MIDTEIKKLIAKIRRAKDSSKKTDIWHSADLLRDEGEQVVRAMVLSLPVGYYKLHSREYGTNISDAIYDEYGWMPSMLVTQRLMLGLQALYPERVYATFTLGLDAIEIKGKSTRSLRKPVRKNKVSRSRRISTPTSVRGLR